ncbi:MAG: phosphate ABC transporter permease PstA [Ktedonobacteraceae bacterium]|nr:phosphate ABC transporter permease PstA [Ktedonobacteraceae bacterium]MBO0793599.1 phosphate ABC transporter permease PstA [Ktedonobacteraceae bacterium]
MTTVTQVVEPRQEQMRRRKGSIARSHGSNIVALCLLWLITVFVSVLFVGIIVQLLVQGAPSFLNASFYGTGEGSIMPQLFNSFYILILTEIFLFPIALAAAIYLVEYARQGPLVSVIHFAAETLAGVPSIVLGLFGFLLFGSILHLGTSRLTGALALLCLNFPIALRLFEDALTAVPRELREGGLALGATKWRTIRTVVLPSALPGLVTGLIISAGKIVGESATLLFTMGIFNPANVFTLNPMIASDTLTTRIYYLKGVGAGTTGLTGPQETAVAAGLAATLILFLLFINIVSRGVSRLIQRKITAA